jgi:hypothetical protein
MRQATAHVRKNAGRVLELGLEINESCDAAHQEMPEKDKRGNDERTMGMATKERTYRGSTPLKILCRK